MIRDIHFDVDGVMPNVHASSKKQLLQLMAEKLEALPVFKDIGVAARDILQAALERERLGSTGVGQGVALPHARISGIDRVYAVFARLDEAVDYEAVDDMPVDLAVLLVAPSNAGGAHLRALAQFSRRLRREDTRERLRTAPDAQSLYIMISQSTTAAAA